MENEVFKSATYPRSVYSREVKALTSARGGQIVPLFASMVKRQDAIRASRISVKIEAEPMVQAIMNGQAVRVQATLVPFSAFERFGSLDVVNWSYMQQPNPHTNEVLPFFQMVPIQGKFWDTLGVHIPKNETQGNSMFLEAYNAYVSWRYSMVSKRISPRAPLDTSLARAPWIDPLTGVIVPDYEQGIIDGEVKLALSGQVNVRGIYQANSNGYSAESGSTFKNTDGETGLIGTFDSIDKDGNPLNRYLAGAQYMAAQEIDLNGDGVITANEIFPRVFADLSQANGVVTLAAINQARNTARFAQVRESIVKKYGRDPSDEMDNAIIDLLMQGIDVPHEFERMPQVLATVVTRMGMNRRWATDGDNLDKQVTTGGTTVELMVSCPRVNSGGVLLVTAEVVPEAIREERPLVEMLVNSIDDLPNAARDINNPHQIKAVRNLEISAYHDEPDNLFGYEPMNNHWRNPIVAIGGRYKYDPQAVYSEDRQRFWKVDVENPVLTEDFYLCPEAMPHGPFADQASDPFTFVSVGILRVEGLTVFGRRLIENNHEYEQTARTTMSGPVVQEVR